MKFRFSFFFSFLLIARITSGQNSIAATDSLNQVFENIEAQDIVAAEKVARLALETSENGGYQKGKADALSNVGLVFLRHGDHKQAMIHFFDALKIYEADENLKKTRGYGSVLIRLAGALYFEGDSKRSIEFANKAKETAISLEDKSILGLSFRVLGENHRLRGKLDSSSYCFNLALQEFSSSNNIEQLANIYTDIGINHYYKKDYKKAILYTTKFLNVSRNLHNDADYVIGLHNVGEFNHLDGNNNLALIYLDSSITLGKKYNKIGLLIDSYSVKAKAFFALKNLDSMNYYYEQTISAKESLYNEKYKSELAKAQTDLDLYKVETVNKLLQKDKNIAMLYRNLAIASALLLAGIIGFILLRQKLKVQKKVKEKLEAEVQARTAKIIKQKEEIDLANLKLRLSLNRSKVDPHFVFNVLNSIQHVVLQKKPVEAQDHLARLSRLMRYILEKSSLEMVSLEDEVKMLEQYILLEKLRLDKKFDHEISIQIGKYMPMLPAMLIQPYVENAILHGLSQASHDNLRLALRFFADTENLIIEIEDNGVGMQKNKTKKHDHNSMGSTLGKERLELLGKLNDKAFELNISDLNSSNGKSGTLVTIKMPLIVYQPEETTILL